MKHLELLKKYRKLKTRYQHAKLLAELNKRRIPVLMRKITIIQKLLIPFSN